MSSRSANNDLEMRQLQETIVALREELERARFQEQEHIQRAISAANDEIRQLRSTVVELREHIDLKQAQSLQKLRDVELQHDRERAELQRTIALLREVAGERPA